MIAETMAGIALVKGAVDGIKSIIGTANDISDIAEHIDNLFEGERQIQQKRNNKQNDPFAIKSIAQETIDAKLAQEKMNEMRQLIDMRFGHGTWQSIINERAKRIQEAREAANEARRQKLIRQKEMEEIVKTILIVCGAILFGGAAITASVMYSTASAMI
jgi:hypothetical protein